MDDVHIEVDEHLKYLGTLKSADDNCNNDIKSRIGMTKKIIIIINNGRNGSFLRVSLPHR